MTLAFLGAVSACVNDDFEDKVVNKPSFDGLALSPSIADAAVVTRTTPSDNKYKEDELVTLDVFVEEVGNTNSFFKKYHLTIAKATKETINNEVAYLLENKWFDQGYRAEKKYNVYVAVNNPMTLEATDETEITNSAALKALTYDEVEAGVAEVNEEGNIISKYLRTETIEGKERDVYAYTGNIYKLYNESASTEETSRDQTPNKKFMMDGWVKNWSPTEGKPIQTIPVNLSRAAAKIVLNVNFDATFLSNLQKEGVTITGSPAWQFQNFAFNAPVFDPKIFGTTTEEDEEPVITPRSSDFMIFGGTEFATDKSFSIITYSYPISWNDYNTGAPSLIVSIPYTSADGSTSYNYYRVPIVTNSTENTSIDRNTIYVINATIATRGSDTHEDVTEMDNLVYNVLEWNSQNNSDAIHNKVEAVQHLYLKVNPVIYTLRGDGDQTLIINYMKATGTAVGWKLFAINPTTEAKGNPVDDPENGVWGWFYDKNGKMKTTFSNWTHMGVEIEQSTEGKNNSSGTVTVTSTALHNRAIKYMLLRVYLKDNPSLYEDVLIRHFPTDNIQSITGSWSSYHSTGGESTTIREYSWDPAADGWAAGTYQSETVDVEVEATLEDYIADPTNVRRNNYDYYDMNDYTWDSDWNRIYYRTYWTAAVPQESRQAANNDANAYGPVEGYYWWGSGSQRTYNNDYDWIQGNYRYRYERFYICQYVKTEQRTRYYRYVEAPGTGNWVDWVRDAGKTGTAKYDSRGDDPNCQNDLFHANIFSGGTVHYLNSTTANNASIGDSRGNSYNNNHMYVIQISSTSDKYVLGKPLVTNNVSQDQVVAPAFMIASQLGIVSVPYSGTTWNSTTAADHCSKYMEVAVDGTRYTGWRLPTADEIEVIVNYQQGKFGDITISSEDRVIAEVLKGANYYDLRGSSTETGISGADRGPFIRCIRELSAEEIDKLNGFDTLINKYQKKPNGN